MKKVLFILILGIFFISSCNIKERDTAFTKTVCGDGICDATESCVCSDCLNTDFCKSKNITQNCEDSNDCTTDSYNPSTNSCIHEKKANCCGNEKCELDENTCDYNTYQTKCQKDCQLACPPKLIVHQLKNTASQDRFSFVCGDSNCELTGNNEFHLKKFSTVQTTISNIGEKFSSQVASSFTCWRETYKIAIQDNDNHYGIIFRDYFNDNQQIVEGINSRISKDNFATYTFSVNITETISPIEIACEIGLSSSDLQNVQTLKFIVS